MELGSVLFFLLVCIPESEGRTCQIFCSETIQVTDQGLVLHRATYGQINAYKLRHVWKIAKHGL